MIGFELLLKFLFCIEHIVYVSILVYRKKVGPPYLYQNKPTKDLTFLARFQDFMDVCSTACKLFALFVAIT